MTFFVGFDNHKSYQLLSDEIEIDPAALTLTQIVLGTRNGAQRHVFDDQNHPDVIFWEVIGANNVVTLKIGQQPIGLGLYRARFVTFDAENTDGIVWPEIEFELKTL